MSQSVSEDLILDTTSKGSRSVKSVRSQLLENAKLFWEHKLKKHDLNWPGKSLKVLVFKKSRMVEFWMPKGDSNVFIHKIPMTAYSGVLGPKYKQGDLQIPEGFYRFDLLNPNSSYHLSIRINYPNKTDLERSRKHKIKNVGGAIMMHGSVASVGCVAIGDLAIERVFPWVDAIGLTNTQVLIFPYDMRDSEYSHLAFSEEVQSLYHELAEELKKYPKPPRKEGDFGVNFDIEFSP